MMVLVVNGKVMQGVCHQQRGLPRSPRAHLHSMPQRLPLAYPKCPSSDIRLTLGFYVKYHYGLGQVLLVSGLAPSGFMRFQGPGMPGHPKSDTLGSQGGGPSCSVFGFGALENIRSRHAEVRGSMGRYMIHFGVKSVDARGVLGYGMENAEPSIDWCVRDKSQGSKHQCNEYFGQVLRI